MTRGWTARVKTAIVVGAMALPAIAGSRTTEASDMTLARDGKTSYVIALADDAIASEKTAAEQLGKYLRQVTGATFPVRSETDVPAGAPQILIGAGRRARRLLPDQDWRSLGSEGIVIETVGQDLILAGGRPRGTLYAVFEFLETAVGCRFWTPTEFDIPHTPELRVAPRDTVYVPPFIRREHHAQDVLENPEFATMMRQNGTYLGQSEAWGGHFVQLRLAFSDLLPPEKHFKEHPHWYTDARNHDLPCTAASAMPADRLVWQLDTSNPEVIDAAAREVIERIGENPGTDTVALWACDNQHYCKCPSCAALVREQGSPSALMLKYVNEVAARVHRVYPHVAAEMQAYWWTVDPPRSMTPGPGVIVEVAPIGADFAHSFDSPWNQASRDLLLGWAKVAPRLNLYYYCTNFRWELFPHPNWFTFGPDFRFFASNNVVNLFDQGANHTGSSGDFTQLRAWLLSRLMWNPSLDQDRLMDEFLNGYYGAAGPYLKQYLRMVQDSFLSRKCLLGTYNADFTFMTLDVANRGYDLFQQAAQAVQNDPTRSARVRRERLSLDVVALAKFNYYHQQARATGKTFLGPDDLDRAFADFEATAKRFGVTGFAEGDITLDDGLAQMKSRLGSRPTVPLPDFARGYGPYQVIDFQPADIHLYARGTLTGEVDDPNASGGKAVMSVGNTTEQTIQIRLGPYLPFDRWRVYVYARADVAPGAPPGGVAFEGGVKSEVLRKMVHVYPFPMERVASDRYALFDLGTHQLDGSKELRFFPLNQPRVTKIYIDRVILIHEGAARAP